MTIDINSLAKLGAQARLTELQTEAERILRAFPDLLNRRPAAGSEVTSPRRGRKRMTAAERRSVSVRMKKYWAQRRQKNDSPKRGPGRPTGSGKPKGLVDAGRAAIAAAQKKRWAAIRKAKKGGGTDVRNG
jgi:hypothetical protein